MSNTIETIAFIHLIQLFIVVMTNITLKREKNTIDNIDIYIESSVIFRVSIIEIHFQSDIYKFIPFRCQRIDRGLP